jgi:hypothetical protein
MKISLLKLVFLLGFLTHSALSTAESTSDFSGVWAATRWATTPWPLEPPFTEAGKAAQEVWKNNNADDPTHRCIFHLVRITSAPFPHEIIQQDERITFLYEYQHQVRRVFLDGRPHPDENELPPSLMGHSTGVIEGDTLVIDTVGVEPGYLRPQGFPHTKNLHVIETHTLLEDGKKKIEMTIDDPEFYREAFTAEMIWQKVDDEIYDYDCEVRNHLSPEAK